MALRISLFGGAGCGKSTTAAYIFWHLKMRQLSAELVSEYVKDWAYEKREIVSTDQQYIFAKQQRKEDRLIRAGVEIVVTDSPLFLNCVYAKQFGADGWPELISLAKKFEKRNPSFNIFIDRGNTPYETEGRYQTYEQALEYDRLVLKFLKEYDVDYVPVKISHNTVADCVLDELVRRNLLSVDKRVCPTESSTT